MWTTRQHKSYRIASLMQGCIDILCSSAQGAGAPLHNAAMQPSSKITDRPVPEVLPLKPPKHSMPKPPSHLLPDTRKREQGKRYVPLNGKLHNRNRQCLRSAEWRLPFHLNGLNNGRNISSSRMGGKPGTTRNSFLQFIFGEFPAETKVYQLSGGKSSGSFG